MSARIRGLIAAGGRAHDTSLLALVLALVALAIGFTHPTLSLQRLVHRQLVVFDITQSMNVVDSPNVPDAPTRLKFARDSALSAIAAMRCGSEVGIGIFSGHRTLVLFAPVEVCRHYGDIAASVRSLDWRMAWKARSEVAKGLHSALISVNALGEDVSVIFVTDGHEAPPINPKRPPRYRGTAGRVRGAVAGVGGEIPRPIPKLDATGQRRGFFKHNEVMQVDPSSLGRTGSSVSGEAMAGVNQLEVRQRIAAGTEHLSSLKDAYLRELSAGLGLLYAPISSPHDLLELLEHQALSVGRPANMELRHALAAIALTLIAIVYAKRPLARAFGAKHRLLRE